MYMSVFLFMMLERLLAGCFMICFERRPIMNRSVKNGPYRLYFSYQLVFLDVRPTYTSTTFGKWLATTTVSILDISFLQIFECEYWFFTYYHYYLQMFLRISNLTTIWKKSLKRYVSVFILFMSFGLMSKTIIMFFYHLI